ncbi:MAG TPA: DMT family transporter [Candidatus Cybelea sp.]|nr:DMT family transporter [Candidatus Cybelea sp.]
MRSTMNRTEWALLLALALLWSAVFLFAKVALGEIRPFTLVLARLGLGAVALHVMVRLGGRAMPWSPRLWASFFAMGALNNLVPFCLIAWGQTQIASGLAAILNATTPLFTVILAQVLTRDERATANKIAGVLVGIAGVAVMIGPGVLRGLSANLAAELAIIGAAISYACAGIYGRRFRDLPPLATATGQVTAGAVMILPLALLFDRPWELALPSLNVWAAVIASAIFCTALGYAVYFRLLATAGATNLLLVTLLMPVGAVLLGMVVLGEQIAARDFAGMSLIALGLAAIDGRALHLLSWFRPLPSRADAPARKR